MTDKTNTPAPAMNEATLMDLETLVQRDIDRFGPDMSIGVHAGLLREMLSKLRAPVANPTLPLEQALHELVSKIAPGLDTGDLLQDAQRTSAMLDAIQARAALASAPVAGEAKEDLAPPKCPITGRPFFMAIKHPELGMVPTYGGPYDSYTIPYMDGEDSQPWHERELLVRRYDHDLGGWRDDEVIPLLVIHEDVLHELQDAAPQASEAEQAIIAAFLERSGQWLTNDAITTAARNAALEEAAVACKETSMMNVDSYCGATASMCADRIRSLKHRAALSAQPGAQKKEGA